METSVGFHISDFQRSDEVSPRGTLLVDGSLHTAPLTEQTPVPMPELVLINYQQRSYPAVTGRKRDRAKESERIFHFSY